MIDYDRNNLNSIFSFLFSQDQWPACSDGNKMVTIATKDVLRNVDDAISCTEQ